MPTNLAELDSADVGLTDAVLPGDLRLGPFVGKNCVNLGACKPGPTVSHSPGLGVEAFASCSAHVARHSLVAGFSQLLAVV